MQKETGARIEVRVQPGASRNAIEAVAGGPVKAYVTAPPEGGKANEAVITLLAKTLDVAKGRVTIVRGHRGKTKLVKIDGLTEKDIFSRLSSVLKSLPSAEPDAPIDVKEPPVRGCDVRCRAGLCRPGGQRSA